MRVNAAGLAGVPEAAPLNPKFTDPPAGMAVFQLTPLAVAFPPDTTTSADHALLIVCPLGTSHTNDQGLTALVPVFFTTTFAVKPPDHTLGVVYVTAHEPLGVVPGNVVTDTAEDGEDVLPAASFATT